ncbi:hypothetical protein FHS89_001434 [Rubricella aquisinus]|uniref:Uncharacterized protein n=1 Tax=Rubricella aquisinus TaxID=2028108 RepID=A0A840WP50_9RHOB|nr:hypothetical protein [Rubricella aquisinus]
MARDKPKDTRPLQVYTLVVELGRLDGDGLPDTASGGGMILYAPGRDEPEAVRDAVRILKDAGLNPLDVESHGTAEEQRADGVDLGQEELDLMDRARAENSVVVAQKEAYYD